MEGIVVLAVVYFIFRSIILKAKTYGGKYTSPIQKTNKAQSQKKPTENKVLKQETQSVKPVVKTSDYKPITSDITARKNENNIFEGTISSEGTISTEGYEEFDFFEDVSSEDVYKQEETQADSLLDGMFNKESLLQAFVMKEIIDKPSRIGAKNG